MQTIKIDFDNPGLPQRLDVVENDAQSRFFKAVLYKDGKAYTAPSGATYSIMYRGFGPQNEGWYDTINDGAGKRAACSVSGNVVTCEIARQALRVPGHVSVVLCVTGRNGYMLHGWPIDCNCRNDNYTGGTSVESFFYITQITNADWTSAIQTWEELKNMIDPTLTLSGKAADAKATGDAVGELKEDLAHQKADSAVAFANLMSEVEAGYTVQSEYRYAGDSADLIAAPGTNYNAVNLPVEYGKSYKMNGGFFNVYTVSNGGATIVTNSYANHIDDVWTPDIGVDAYLLTVNQNSEIEFSVKTEVVTKKAVSAEMLDNATSYTQIFSDLVVGDFNSGNDISSTSRMRTNTNHSSVNGERISADWMNWRVYLWEYTDTWSGKGWKNADFDVSANVEYRLVISHADQNNSTALTDTEIGNIRSTVTHRIIADLQNAIEDTRIFVVNTTDDINSNTVFLSRECRINGYPGNSIPGALECLRNGIRHLRVSVRNTADDVPVLQHDATIYDEARTSNGGRVDQSITIAGSTLAQLNQYDYGVKYSYKFVGLKICTLNDFLRMCALTNAVPTLELKDRPAADNTDAYVKQICGMVAKWGLAKTAWISTDYWPLMQAFHVAMPTLNMAYIAHMTKDSIDRVEMYHGEYNDVRIDMFEADDITDELCYYSAEHGVSVKVGSIYDKSNIMQWVERGVKYIEVYNIPNPNQYLRTLMN